MPTSYVRLIMAGLTVVLAVFTGLVTGFVAGGPGCDEVGGSTPASVVSSDPAPGGQAPAPTQGSNDGGIQGDQSSKPGFGVGNTLTLTHASGTDCSGFSALTAIFGFAGALFTGAIVGGAALFLPREERQEQQRHPEPAYARVGAATGSHPVIGDPPGLPVAAPGSPIAPAPETRRLVKERRTLVETCIYVRDRASSKAISDRLAWALNEVGVVEDRPDGERFDTARHEAGGTAPTDEQHRDGTIAAVEITGYTDRGQVVRAPVVTVYRSDPR